MIRIGNKEKIRRNKVKTMPAKTQSKPKQNNVSNAPGFVAPGHGSRITYKKRDRYTRRGERVLVNDILIPFFALAGIIVLAGIVAYLVSDPLTHPSHHPRIWQAVWEVQHHHPRACWLLQTSIWWLIAARILVPVAVRFWNKQRWRKRARFNQVELKSDRYLNKPVESSKRYQTVPA